MSRSVVITGVGIVSPGGNGTDIAWRNMKQAKNAIGAITKFDPAGLCAPRAGEVTINATDYISARLAKKMDPFSLYALIACDFALMDSGLDLDVVDKERMGAFVGNCLGGWTFTEPQLRALHTTGLKAISPFLASAWFPAAPQGQITIHYQLKGHSKTLDCGRASGLAAIGYGARAIASGQMDMLLAGGTEALVTPFAMVGCGIEGLTESGHCVADDYYRPFDTNRKGWIPGEGAAFLVMETLAHARSRNASIYCEVTGFGSANRPCHPKFLPVDAGKTLGKAMVRAIKDAGIAPAQLDLVMADALGTPYGDRSESEAIRETLTDSVPVTAPKSMIGHLYGAAGAMDTALAAMSIKQGCVLPTINVDNPDPDCGLNIVTSQSIERDLNHVLINNRGGGGIASSLVVSRCPR